MDEIQVSIICNAYNHEKYIRDALEGFVMQKTNFPFEILIHDDASTDRTAEIIREYEEKYPEILKPIYEVENQYSKKDGSLSRIQYGRVRGKYIALCEGDDYWTDPYKLQKQYDALEAHPEINICATFASIEKDGSIVGKVPNIAESCIIPVEDVIIGDGGFVATASLMYRASVRSNYSSVFSILQLDYTIQITGSLHNGMIYISDNTTTCRQSTEGSWTMRMSNNVQAFIKNKEKIIEMLTCLDNDTDNKYHYAIDNRKRKYNFDILILENKYRAAFSKEYEEFYKDLWKTSSIKGKCLILISYITPALSQLMRKVKRKLHEH